MFGYVSPLKEELAEGQYDAFRAYYCGVCKQMGGLSRLALSFECAFIACTLITGTGTLITGTGTLITGTGTMDEFHQELPVQRRMCPANPLRRKDMVINEATAYGADINIILAYHKVLDDIHDDGRLRYRLARFMLKRQYRKACKRRPEIADLVIAALGRLNMLEQAGCSSSDAIAHEFAQMFSDIANPGDADEERKKLFYNIGRWIYLIDALADYKDDMREGNYNVLALEWGDYAQALAAMDFSLWHTLSEAERAVDEINFPGFIGSIVENVVVKSLPITTMATLCKGGLKPEPI